MITGLEEIDPVVTDEINKTVFLGETAGPDAGGKEFKRFGLANAGEGVTHDRLDQVEGPERHLPVGFNPVAQIVQELRLEDGLAEFIFQDRYSCGELR